MGTAGLTGIEHTSGLGCFGVAGSPAKWNERYATAAVRLLVAYGVRERRLAKLWASVYGPNHASARVLEKAGLEREAVRREGTFVDGTRVDVHCFCLLADEWDDQRDDGQCGLPDDRSVWRRHDVRTTPASPPRA